jgi:hypothetical protein
MSGLRSGGIAAVALVFALTGCATAGSAPDAPASPGVSDGPTAPAPSISTGPDAQARLTDLPTPSATEPVLAIGTVLEHDDGAIICVGSVSESAPPQCEGLQLTEGWDWAASDPDEAGGVRWNDEFAVPGAYDATAQTFAQTGEPLSLAVINLAQRETPPRGDLDEATIAAVQEDLSTIQGPNMLGVASERGTVVLHVTYDDGSVQAALDDIYGEGVVFVVPALR